MTELDKIGVDYFMFHLTLAYFVVPNITEDSWNHWQVEDVVKLEC